MFKRVWIVFVAAAVLGLVPAGGTVSAQDAAKGAAKKAAPPKAGGTATGLPKEAARAVQDLYPKGTIPSKVDVEEDQGMQVYVVSLKDVKPAVEVQVTALGAVLSVGTEVTMKEVPDVASMAIVKAFGEAKLRIVKQEVRAEVKKEGTMVKVVKTDPVKIVYEARVLQTKSPRLRGGAIEVAADGTVIKAPVEKPVPAKGGKAGAKADDAPSSQVLPAPQIVRGDGSIATLVLGNGIFVVRAQPAPAVDPGRKMLARRLKLLAGVALRADAGDGPAHLVVQLMSPDTFARALKDVGGPTHLTADQRSQAYLLAVTSGAGQASVTVQACSDVGAYYGLATLCQLLDVRDGAVTVPVVTIVDWPAIGFRVAKSSATFDPLSSLEQTVRAAPAMKINFFGLQYHQGTKKENGRGLNHKGNWETYSSKDPQPPFKTNVAHICKLAAAEGLVKTIVYFSPFRGKSYFHMDREEDRAAYMAFLDWCMEQGAAGIEIDYNDWCMTERWEGHGTEWPMEKVVSFVRKHVRKRYPDAYVLWCPPMRAQGNDGKPFGYLGAVTPGYAAVLKQIPADVKVIWTGPVGPPGQTATIVEPMPSETVQAWVRAAGRKPLLWLNQPAEKHKDGDEIVQIFAGQRLPKDLGEHVCGVHLNGAPTLAMRPYDLMAADFLWNPPAWSVDASLARARRFADIMQPPLEEAGE